MLTATLVSSQTFSPPLSFAHVGVSEVLLVAWGVFFVARRGDTTPTQKARNFSKAIQRGVQRDKRPIAKEGPSPPPGIASDAKDDGEQQLK